MAERGPEATIISNGNGYPKVLRIEHYFKFVLLAPEVGIDKPNPEIFHLAIKKADCLPEEMLYVGDSQEDDIIGCKNVGIKVVWFNRNKEQLKHNIPKPDYEINRLSVLLSILRA
jgi:putative hydrolase of the HAD superfamily